MTLKEIIKKFELGDDDMIHFKSHLNPEDIEEQEKIKLKMLRRLALNRYMGPLPIRNDKYSISKLKLFGKSILDLEFNILSDSSIKEEYGHKVLDFIEISLDLMDIFDKCYESLMYRDNIIVRNLLISTGLLDEKDSIFATIFDDKGDILIKGCVLELLFELDSYGNIIKMKDVKEYNYLSKIIYNIDFETDGHNKHIMLYVYDDYFDHLLKEDKENGKKKKNG